MSCVPKHQGIFKETTRASVLLKETPDISIVFKSGATFQSLNDRIVLPSLKDRLVLPGREMLVKVIFCAYANRVVNKIASISNR